MRRRHYACQATGQAATEARRPVRPADDARVRVVVLGLGRQAPLLANRACSALRVCISHPPGCQKLNALEKDLCQANLENHQLRLEVHRWRKQHALVKLRLAGAQEDFDLQASHSRQLEARCETLEAARAALGAEADGLRAALADARGQLDELLQLKTGTELEAAKLKARWEGMEGRDSTAATLQMQPAVVAPASAAAVVGWANAASLTLRHAGLQHARANAGGFGHCKRGPVPPDGADAPGYHACDGSLGVGTRARGGAGSGPARGGCGARAGVRSALFPLKHDMLGPQLAVAVLRQTQQSLPLLPPPWADRLVLCSPPAQLAALRRREAESAAAQSRMQGLLDSTKADLAR